MLQIFPALERAFPGTVLTRSLVLELLIKYAGPTGLRGAGRGNVLRWARNHSRKVPDALIDAVFAALGEQTVTVAGTEAVELVIPPVVPPRLSLPGPGPSGPRTEHPAPARDHRPPYPCHRHAPARPGTGFCLLTLPQPVTVEETVGRYRQEREHLMSTQMNEPEEPLNDGSRPKAIPVTGHPTGPTTPKEVGSDLDGGHPEAATDIDPADGHRTITPGPAEEENRREADDRGLTTDTGSSD